MRIVPFVLLAACTGTFSPPPADPSLPLPTDPEIDPVDPEDEEEDTEVVDPIDNPTITLGGSPTGDTGFPVIPFNPVLDPFDEPDPALHTGRFDLYTQGVWPSANGVYAVIASFWIPAAPNPGNGVLNDAGSGWDDCMSWEGDLVSPLRPLSNAGTLTISSSHGTNGQLQPVFNSYGETMPGSPDWGAHWTVDASGAGVGPWTLMDAVRYPASHIDVIAPRLDGTIRHLPSTPLAFTWAGVDLAEVEIRLQADRVTVLCRAVDDGDFEVDTASLSWLPTDTDIDVQVSRIDHRWVDVGNGDQLELLARSTTSGTLVLEP